MGIKKEDVKINFGHLITDPEEYMGLFLDVTDEKAVGEASTTYLKNPGVAERIKEHVPDAKLIAIFRNPVDRAYSNFWLQVGRTMVPVENFVPFVKNSEQLSAPEFAYGTLEEYYELFGSEKIRVYMFEDFIKNPKKTMKDIFRFLEVDEKYELKPQETVYNKNYIKNGNKVFNSKIYKNVVIKENVIRNAVKNLLPMRIRNMIRSKVMNQYSLEPPVMPASIRREMTEFYAPGILKLQEITGFDLSGWLKV